MHWEYGYCVKLRERVVFDLGSTIACFALVGMAVVPPIREVGRQWGRQGQSNQVPPLLPCPFVAANPAVKFPSTGPLPIRMS